MTSLLVLLATALGGLVADASPLPGDPAASAPPARLAYEDAVARALEANPALQRAALSAQQSDADVRAAWGRWDPTLSLRGGYNRTLSLQFQAPFPDPFQSVTTSYNTGFNLAATAPTGTSVSLDGNFFSFRRSIDTDQGAFEQTFFQPEFRINLEQELIRGLFPSFNLATLRQAREQVSLTTLRYEAARQSAIASTAAAYWAWVGAEEAARIAELAVDVATESARVGRAKVDAGEVAPVEGTRLDAARAEAMSTALQARQDAEAARDRLLLLIGAAPGAIVEPATAPELPLLGALDVTEAIAVAQTQSLDLALLRASVEAAESAVRDSRHALLPTLTFGLNAGLSGGDAESWQRAFEFLGGFPTVGVNGTFAVPLGNRAALGQRDRAMAALEDARVQLAEAERQLASDVAAQVRVLRRAREAIALADLQRQLAEETLAAEEALYAAGRTLLKDVLEARQGLDRARTDAVRARIDALTAGVELRRLQGGL